VSYIYSYPGGVKDKNVGFAKVEVVRGEIRLNINLRGVYTDTPELFGVYLLSTAIVLVGLPRCITCAYLLSTI
jgi:hypothetical protein